MSGEKIRVGIVGSGIVGSTLANLLLKHPDKIEFEIFESARQFTEIGAGIGIWARAMNVLREAGVYDAASKVAVKPDPNDPTLVFDMRISDQKPNGYEFGSWKFEGAPVFFHRAALLNVLVSNLPKEKVHFGKRLSSYERVLVDNGTSNAREDIVLHFTDGTSSRVDVLVACDGIKSAVRRQMFSAYATEIGAPVEEYVEKYIEPAWSGSTAYRSLIPVDELRKVNPENSILKHPQLFYGMDKHLIVFQPNPTQINMVAFVSDPSKEGTRYPDKNSTKDVSQEELLHSFEDFESDAQDIFKLMPKPSLWAINQLKETLPFFSRGNVVLVGDAAHAMTPHLGVGAGMGIEDASVLTHFLTSAHISRSTIPVALKAYDTARVQKTGEVHDRARNAGKTYEFRTEGVGRDTVKIKEWVKDNVDHIIEWKVEDDIRNGLAWIDGEVKRQNALGARL